jgi:hypothetical protein
MLLESFQVRAAAVSSSVFQRPGAQTRERRRCHTRGVVGDGRVCLLSARVCVTGHCGKLMTWPRSTEAASWARLLCAVELTPGPPGLLSGLP